MATLKQAIKSLRSSTKRVVVKVSDQTTDIIIMLEFPKWHMQLPTSLHFLLIEVFI